MNVSRLSGGKVFVETSEGASFDSSCDLFVVGLGTSGAIAAVAAARMGMNVLGIDKLACMGGSATAGGVNGYYFGLPGGIFESVDSYTRELDKNMMAAARCFNHSSKLLTLERFVYKSGAKFAYDSVPLGVLMEGKHAVGLEWLSPEGVRRTSCNFIIDATGDGELAAMAGCRYRYGRESDGTAQPFSYTRNMFTGGFIGYANFDAGYVDIRDARSISEALIHGGKLHLREKFDDENNLLVNPALMLGHREGRLIEGTETLSFKDYVCGKVASEPILYAYTNFDTHTQDWAFESDIFQEWLTVGSLWGQNVSIPVPVGVFIPAGVEGILTAGRCLSADHEMAQALRMERCMQKSGEVVGVLAALATKQGVSASEVKVADLKAELERTDCLNSCPHPPPQIGDLLIHDPDKIRESLASDAPGIAIWSCRNPGDELKAKLKEWMLSGNDNLCRHAALAAGLSGDTASLEVLRKIISEKDPFVPSTGRSHNARRICAAVFLVGRLGDIEDIPSLASLLHNPGSEQHDVFSYALAALLT
ncbi:MAG: FAD-dependent oxidoreductase [Victivallales bacterium]|nr:FAD-dependent oxidoreductase [Victivallales bacterium]